ncbi:MAG: hypothetical protein M3Z56_00375 [Bacteroidota bacterium]|nr:hypothetical protein [Bacteroidota bacterium]
MEGNKKTRNSKNNSFQKKKNPLLPIIENKGMDSASDKEKSSEREDTKKIVTHDEEKRRNYWSGYKEPIVVSTLLLFIFTALLYYEASQSGKAAKDAADVAKTTLDEYKKEFEAANRPDVSMFNFKIFEIPGSTFLTCTYEVINTGRLRAAFKDFTIQEHIGTDTSHYSFNSTKKPVIINQFLQANATYTLNELVVHEAQQKKDFLSGNTALFFDCNYEYYNEAINKDYVTHFLNKLYYANGVLANVAVSFHEEEKNIK